MNVWKTADIRITKDSAGFYWAEHKFAGTLIESGMYEDRNECRRDAVEELMERKEEDESRWQEAGIEW
jgi:hypothetical protein